MFFTKYKGNFSLHEDIYEAPIHFMSFLTFVIPFLSDYSNPGGWEISLCSGFV